MLINFVITTHLRASGLKQIGFCRTFITAYTSRLFFSKYIKSRHNSLPCDNIFKREMWGKYMTCNNQNVFQAQNKAAL